MFRVLKWESTGDCTVVRSPLCFPTSDHCAVLEQWRLYFFTFKTIQHVTSLTITPNILLVLVRKCIPCKIFVVYSSTHSLCYRMPTSFIFTVLLFNRNPSRKQFPDKAIQKHEQSKHGHVDGDFDRLHSFGGQPERLGRGLRDFGDDPALIDPGD